MLKDRKIIILLTTLIISLFFTSCKIGKAYSRPDLQLPDSIIAGQDTLSFGDAAWWDVYSDSTLRALIDKSLNYNKDMLTAAARVREMAYRKRVATSKTLPGFNGEIEDEYERENHGGEAFKESNTFEIHLRLAWELDLWGNLRWGRAKSIAEYLQSVEAQRALQMSIVAEVAQSYYELVALDTELDIVRQTLKAREEGVRLAQIRFEGGLTSETSYRQALVELARTATLIPDLERKIALKENDIAFLAGEYPGHVERGKMLKNFSLPQELPVGLPSDLLRRRPDVRRAEQQLIAANARVGVAFTDMFPRIRLIGGGGIETLDFAKILKSPHEIIAINLLGPIFNWGRYRSTWKAEKEAYEAEVHSYEKTVLNAFKETHNAIVNYNKIREVYEVRHNLERSARSYLDLAQLQYINGVINYMDVLDAQRGYLDAQIGLSNAVRDELLAIVGLYKALGGGWQTDTTEAK